MYACIVQYILVHNLKLSVQIASMMYVYCTLHCIISSIHTMYYKYTMYNEQYIVYSV